MVYYLKYLSRIFIYAILCLQLVACSEGILNHPDYNGLTAIATSDSILIINRTNKTVGLFLVERNSAELIDWLLDCWEDNRLNPNESKYFAYENIFGYTENCEVIVYWWHCDSNFTPGFMNHLIIEAY